MIDRSLALQKRSASKAQEVKKISLGNRDVLLILLPPQTREKKTEFVASDDASAKPQQVKKASKTQGNNIPQAIEETPRHSAPNAPAT